jgi:hypothetical protein
MCLRATLVFHAAVGFGMAKLAQLVSKMAEIHDNLT